MDTYSFNFYTTQSSLAEEFFPFPPQSDIAGVSRRTNGSPCSHKYNKNKTIVSDSTFLIMVRHFIECADCWNSLVSVSLFARPLTQFQRPLRRPLIKWKKRSFSLRLSKWKIESFSKERKKFTSGIFSSVLVGPFAFSRRNAIVEKCRRELKEEFFFMNIYEVLSTFSIYTSTAWLCLR